MKYFISILSLCQVFLSQAQLGGDLNVIENQDYHYEYDDGYLIPWGVVWTVTGGTVISTTVNGSSNMATIRFTSPGSQTITARRTNNQLLGVMNVTVTANSSCPSQPSALSVSSNSCGNKIITRGTPPSGTTWYWQVSSSGTSTSNSSTTYTKTTSGTVYIRARSNSNGCWSSARTTNVFVTPCD